MSNEFDDIFSNNSNDEQIEVLDLEDNPPVEEKPKKKLSFDFDLKNDKILLTQIILFSVWLILTVVIYFFCYPLLEPFINL